MDNYKVPLAKDRGKGGSQVRPTFPIVFPAIIWKKFNGSEKAAFYYNTFILGKTHIYLL